MRVVKDSGGGRRKAVEIIYDIYYQPLVRFAFNMIRDEEAAKDVVSGIFERLLEMRRDVTTEKKIRDYLFTATKNASLNHLRRCKVVNVYQQWAIRKLNADELDNFVVKAMVDSENARNLHKAITYLPDENRSVVEDILNGEKVLGIAKKMGLSPQAVRGKRARAFRTLKISISSCMLLSLLIRPAKMYIVNKQIHGAIRHIA